MIHEVKKENELFVPKVEKYNKLTGLKFIVYRNNLVLSMCVSCMFQCKEAK
jgi:hypothetical protein